MEYARIENGQIVEGPMSLPGSWKNISGLHLLPVEQLKERGWLPVSDAEKPAYNPATERLTVSNYGVGENSVTRNWIVSALNSEDIQRLADLAQRIADIQAMLPTWEQAVTAIKNAFPDPAQQNVVLKIAKLLAWSNGVRPVQP